MTKILIIEDEEMLRGMYQERFEQEEFEVSGVASTEEALAFLQESSPDLILLDILLTEADGLSFLERRRRIPGAEAIPVVAFSNFDDPEARTKAKELGAKEYLLKTDYTPQEIVEVVKRYLPA